MPVARLQPDCIRACASRIDAASFSIRSRRAGVEVVRNCPVVVKFEPRDGSWRLGSSLVNRRDCGARGLKPEVLPSLPASSRKFTFVRSWNLG